MAHATQLFGFGSPKARVRKVEWSRVPLGSVIIEWPTINNAPIPELMEYPVITESLRAQLGNKYHLLPGTMVSIADPDPSVDRKSIREIVQDARRLVTGLEATRKLKDDLRWNWMHEDTVRSGLASLGQYENTPYTLTKDWNRTITSTVRNSELFGASIWHPSIGDLALVDLIPQALEGSLRLKPNKTSIVNVGIDVSYSMKSSGKADFAVDTFFEILPALAQKLGTSTWRVFLVSEDAHPVDWSRLLAGTTNAKPKKPEQKTSGRAETSRSRSDSVTGGFSEQESTLDVLLRLHHIKPAGTAFAPFFRKVLFPDEDYDQNLCLLITDGACDDREMSLRLAEKMAKKGIDYMQVILHIDEENRKIIVSNSSGGSLDGVSTSTELRPGEVRVSRTDEELHEYSERVLREVTDYAEAAHGSQLILNWYPLFSFLSLDIYEQYLGSVLMA